MANPNAVAPGFGFLATQPYLVPDPRTVRSANEEAVVCVICGGICVPTVQSSFNPLSIPSSRNWMSPMLIKAYPGFSKWCNEPSATPTDDKLFHFAAVEQFLGGSAGFYNRWFGRMEINTHDSEMYLPVHAPCLELAKKFCISQSKLKIDFRNITSDLMSGGPSRLAHLYEIWMKRAWMSDPRDNGSLYKPIIEPHGYFGASVFGDTTQYVKAKNNNIGRFILQESDPSSNDLQTARSIMRLVVQIDEGTMENREPDPEFVELKARLDALSPELRNMIADAVQPFNDIGPSQLACTRVYPPEWWMGKLISGEFFPWLDDLHLVLMQKALYPHLANVPVTVSGNRHLGIPGVRIDHLDWELLCRQLAQRDPFSGRNAIVDANLENRFRIWRLLSSSRLGHTVGVGI
ncbi:hypothetical protein F4781DRAFT_119205 [Annulohypoxylon bovei var. microspora]|nr:hypothetical protein F4781DRAFT_119205 [Annulohypoxylon bovei var. microspora]